MRHPLTRRPRGGFTLVELLVACALTVLIMAVLATAFQTGLSTFSHLKSTVGLSEQLRAAEAIIRRDLEATHLESADGVAVKVSNTSGSFTKGYLEVLQGSVLVPLNPVAMPYMVEGTEDGVNSCRATDHAMFFTSKLRGDSRQEVFVGRVPAATPLNPDLQDYAVGGSAATEWAELGYFLRVGNVMTVSDDPAALPLKLFTLHRRQKLLGTGATPLPLLPAAGGKTNPYDWWNEFPEASISTRPMPTNPFAGVNDVTSVVGRNNRSYILFTDGTSPAPTTTPTFNQAPASGISQGTDILVTNVVSMQIRVMDATGKFLDQLPNAAVAPASGFAYDTSSPGTAKVRAIQIKLRVYDTKNHLTRQTTMTFDL